MNIFLEAFPYYIDARTRSLVLYNPLATTALVAGISAGLSSITPIIPPKFSTRREFVRKFTLMGAGIGAVGGLAMSGMEAWFHHSNEEWIQHIDDVVKEIYSQ